MQGRLRFLCWVGVAALTVAALAVPHGVAVAADDPAHAAHPDGVPLDFKYDLALWSLVTFVCFILLLRKFAWAPMVAGLDKRESRIRQDIADAETARVRAEQMLVEHQRKLDKVQDEVKEILAEARRDADQARLNIMQTAQTEAEATRKRAIVEIERARDQALKELFDAMSGQVVAATEYVLGHGLTSADQDELVQRALAEIGSEAK